MRVIGIIGSPRKNGSTASLVRQILAGAASAGAQTAEYFLNELDFKGCQACMHCKSHDVCQQEDDMSRLTEEIKKADAFVIGSPIYMGNTSSQTKTFHDRLYYFGPGPGFPSKMPAGKKAALVFSQNNPNDQAFSQYIEPLPHFLTNLGVQVVDTLFAGGGTKALEDEAFMQKVFQTGVELVK